MTWTPSQADLVWLAKFAGATRRHSHESSGNPSRPQWLLPESARYRIIDREDWHPHRESEHTDLVLRAIIAKGPEGICKAALGLIEKLNQERKARDVERLMQQEEQENEEA